LKCNVDLVQKVMVKKGNSKKVAALILAAGQSKRMGTPKQLLPFNGQPMIADICKKLVSLDLHSIACITGSENNLIEKVINKFPMQAIYNADFKQGMNSSLVTGINSLSSHNNLEGVLITLADQPTIPLAHYQLMVATFNQNTQSIVSTSYGDSYGVPSIFPSSLFSELQDLGMDKGAKSIIKKYLDKTKFILCEEALNDIDSPEDYRKLIG